MPHMEIIHKLSLEGRMQVPRGQRKGDIRTPRNQGSEGKQLVAWQDKRGWLWRRAWREHRTCVGSENRRPYRDKRDHQDVKYYTEKSGLYYGDGEVVKDFKQKHNICVLKTAKIKWKLEWKKGVQLKRLF